MVATIFKLALKNLFISIIHDATILTRGVGLWKINIMSTLTTLFQFNIIGST